MTAGGGPKGIEPFDARWMRAALEWSRRGKGWTSPRPSVGCVLIQPSPGTEGRLLAGAHTVPGHGNPHAEIAALRLAKEKGEDPRGATCYVTLEPCCHYGTTPPCTDALIEAGIKRVVAGVLDPNPAVNNRGFEQLMAAGIEVVSGFMAAECHREHEDFLKFIVAQTPFVTLKMAVSLDGKIATASGESQWITGDAARRRAHELRHQHDAVLIGIGTALADDPLLTVRLEGDWKQPARVVLDGGGRLPLDSKLVRSAGETPLYLAVADLVTGERQQQFEEAGVNVLRIKTESGRLDLKCLVADLFERGICSILIEGGPNVAGSALQAGIVDRVTYMVAPVLLPGGRSATEGFAIERLAEAERLSELQIEQLGGDLMITGRLAGKG